MFSSFYDALNARNPSLSPDGSSPTHQASSPTSPSGSTIKGTGEGSGSSLGGMGYAAYQRRPKPSLEDRLKAKLVANEAKKALQDKEQTELPARPSTEESLRTSISEPQKLEEKDAAQIPLPISPPVEATQAAPSLQGMASMVLASSQSQDHPLPPVPEIRQVDPTPPTLTTPASPPFKPNYPNISSTTLSDPLSPQFPPPALASASVQELKLPSPTVSPTTEYSDPLSASLMELEREKQAAAAKARSPRSPPPPTPPHTSPSKHHSSHRSISSNRASIEKDPFARLESPPPEGLRHAASLDQILRSSNTSGIFESLGIEGVADAQSLKDWVEGMKKKSVESAEEVTKLHGKLSQQESRMEELRDMHRIESRSSAELIDSLREKVTETEAKVTSVEKELTTERSLLAAERSTRESLIAAERAKNSTGVADLEVFKGKLKEVETENDKLKNTAKEEEEKRTKAISLLKTVRTKLIQAEKDRDEALGKLDVAKASEQAVGQKGEEELRTARLDVERLKAELERVKAESMKEAERVRDDVRRELERRGRELEAEVANVKDALERDFLARRGEWEIESIATRTVHQREVANLNAKISSLSNSLTQLNSEREQLFTDLQLRQSEVESSRIQLESIQAQLTETTYQLRERDEQLAMFQVELVEARKSSSTGRGSHSTGGPSGAEVTRMLKEAESRAEARVADLRSRLKTIESERAEQEDNWSRTLAARGEEIERLRGMLSFQEKEGMKIGDYKATRDKEVSELEERIRVVEKEKAEERRKHREIMAQLNIMTENLEAKEFEISELKGRVDAINGLVDELKGKESQLKTSNKTLRDELRKVQSSAALLERQRNPGVGYWASNTRPPLNGGDTYAPSSSSIDLTRPSSARPGTPTSANPSIGGATDRASSAGSARSSMEVSKSTQGEEEVNLEYLRNVILQFLEHEKMRPNLVRVLSVILHFTPQETRRLLAKI